MEAILGISVSKPIKPFGRSKGPSGSNRRMTVDRLAERLGDCSHMLELQPRSLLPNDGRNLHAPISDMNWM